MAGCVVGAAGAPDVARGIVTGAAANGAHGLAFFAHPARMPDAIISTTAASMAHPVVGAAAPAVSGSVVATAPAAVAR
jgi:hypothetical protein